MEKAREKVTQFPPVAAVLKMRTTLKKLFR
jgi:hypothetical protein